MDYLLLKLNDIPGTWRNQVYFFWLFFQDNREQDHSWKYYKYKNSFQWDAYHSLAITRCQWQVGRYPSPLVHIQGVPTHPPLDIPTTHRPPQKGPGTRDTHPIPRKDMATRIPPPPWTEWLTDAFENITFLQLLLRVVII